MLDISYKLLHPEAKVPTKSNFEDGGWDLYSVGKYTVYSSEITKVHTGIAVGIPRGYVGLIWDRSGLSIKQGLHRVAGVIDSGYVGEIIVGLTSLSHNPGHIDIGDRIAQLVIQEVPLHVMWSQVEEFEETNRGSDGFGSTGK